MLSQSKESDNSNSNAIRQHLTLQSWIKKYPKCSVEYYALIDGRAGRENIWFKVAKYLALLRPSSPCTSSSVENKERQGWGGGGGGGGPSHPTPHEPSHLNNRKLFADCGYRVLSRAAWQSCTDCVTIQRSVRFRWLVVSSENNNQSGFFIDRKNTWKQEG